jgi:acyl-CoA hydrolase
MHSTPAEAASLASVLLPRDLVVVQQGVGEPSVLTEQLIHAGTAIPGLEIFVGLSHSDVFTKDTAGSLELLSFGAMGPLASLAAAGRVSVIPCHFADIARVLARRASGRLVVLMQVSSPDPDGYHSVGLGVDYAYELVGQARAVVAEVNQQLPVTSGPRVHTSAFTAVVRTSRPPPVVRQATVLDVHRRIGALVAQLVPDGATIQLGVGSVSSVVGAALSSKRNLRVRSGLAGDWLLTLARSGALSDEPGSVVISEAAGSLDLYDFVVKSAVAIQSVREVSRPDLLSHVDHFVAMNSALQVDLTGQVNAEELDRGYVGGVGGQPDFLRAAQRSTDGRSIVMLPSTSDGGLKSRIVPRLDRGTVTTPRSGVDFVVTEHGIADLRGRSLRERTQALVAIAAPQHRESLCAQPGLCFDAYLGGRPQ